MSDTTYRDRDERGVSAGGADLGAYPLSSSAPSTRSVPNILTVARLSSGAARFASNVRAF